MATNLQEINEASNGLFELIEVIMGMDDGNLNSAVRESIQGMLQGAFSPTTRENSVATILKDWKANNYSLTSAKAIVDKVKSDFNDYIDSLQPSLAKREILQDLFNNFFAIYDEALTQYHTEAIVLPMTLDEGAQVPTYAHDTDVAADLYASETMTLAAHSLGNMVKTGVHIQLPEGWMAMIFPRSSIGLKTGLRLSNSCGIIDTGYLGQLGVLYDNISDSDYTINAGDRIAQLLVMPSYRFKAQVVNHLNETDRNEGGFGSSGK